jgi:hypothetical protein
VKSQNKKNNGFYEVGNNGKCPTMDEQEKYLFDYYAGKPLNFDDE